MSEFTIHDNQSLKIGHKLAPLAIILLGIWISTQLLAYRMGYVESVLGRPVFLIKGYPVYFPLGYLFWGVKYALNRELYGLFFETALPIFFSCFFSLALFIYLSLTRRVKSQSGIYGNARLATNEDLERFGLLAKNGIVLGQMNEASLKLQIKNGKKILVPVRSDRLIIKSDRSDTSGVLIGPPRVYKSGSVMTTLYQDRRSMVIVDYKGELYDATSGYRATMSHVVRLSLRSRECARFNILNEIRPGINAYNDAMLIAGTHVFTGESGSGSSNLENHFLSRATDLLTGIILHVVSCPHETNKSMGGVLDFLSNIPKDLLDSDISDTEMVAKLGDISRTMFIKMATLPHVDEIIHKQITNIAGRILQTQSKERASIISTVLKAIQFYEDLPIRENTSLSDVTISELMSMDKPVTVYYTVPYSEVDLLAPLIRVFFTFLLRRLAEGEINRDYTVNHNLLCLFDEFPLLGKYPFIQKTLGILHGYGISFFLVCQSIDQLVELYGQNHGFWDLCETFVTYAPGSNLSAKLIAELIGKTSAWRTSSSASGSKFKIGLGNMGRNDFETQIDLFTPDQIRRLSFDQEIILNHGMNPYIGKKIVYFKDRRFRDKQKLRPLTKEQMLTQLPRVNPHNNWYRLCDQWVGNKSISLTPTVKIMDLPQPAGHEDEDEQLTPSLDDIRGFI